MTARVAILGIFVADTTYRAERPPRMGETVLGKSFALGPGGKGSNQAVAAGKAARADEVTIITRLGDDDFADLAEATWREAGVRAAVTRDAMSYTGAAYIFVEDATGDNAIIVAPGAAEILSAADVEAAADAIRGAYVFVTQLEQPVLVAEHALRMAREAGVTTILNPAPATELSDAMIGLCDWLTPNETEAEALTGIEVKTIDEAERAADALIARGAGAVVVTLGERGALLRRNGTSEHVDAFHVGPVSETTGAGDAFNGAFAVALAEGMEPVDAVRFGCAAASISVTRLGTAASSPVRDEIDALLARNA